MLKDGDKNVENYEGEILKGQDTGYQDEVAVNLVYVDMKQSIPQYYSKNPKIFFDPEVPGSEKAAEVTELIVNEKWGQLKMKSKIRAGIKSAKLYGVCGFKTYFNFQKEFIKDSWDESIFNDEVRTDRVPLKQLLKDPDASGWNTSSWIGHEIEARVDDIAKKFGLDEIDKNKITVTRSTRGSADLDAQYGDQAKADFKSGTYYEIEDRRAGKIFTLIDGLDKFVDGPKGKGYDYDTMYDFLAYNDIPDRPDVKSDYHFWRPQLEEVARFRTMQLNHAKKGGAKYKWMGTAPTEDQKTQIKDATDSSFVELQGGQDIQPLQHAQLDPQIFAAEQAVRSDIQLISKQAPRQSTEEKTATEVKAVEAAAQEVTSENLERLEEVMASIANKWAKLMQKNYTASRVISLTEVSEAEFMGYKNSFGDVLQGEANRPFLKVTKKDLQGQLKARVKAGSTLPDNDQARMNKLMGFAKFVTAIPGAASAIDMEEMLDEAVQVFDVRNDNLLVRKDNPMEESRLLNSGVFISAKLSEDHDKHLEIHEQESNNNSQNLVHILEHKLFKQQKELNQAASIKSQLGKVQDPISGQSFMGAAPLQPQGPLPASQPPLPTGPMPLGGSISGQPQGVIQ